MSGTRGSKSICQVIGFSCIWSLIALVAAVAAAEQSIQGAGEAKRNWSQNVQRAIGFEDAQFWSDGTAVSSPRKSGTAALRWDKHTKHPTLECGSAPHDLSAFNVMTFWLHSNQARDATFMVILESPREAGVFSYYSNQVSVDWTGWKKVELHFRSFQRARDPVGWDQIEKIRFTASGWDQHPTDEPVWVLDDLDFHYTSEPYRPHVGGKKYVAAPERGEFLARLRHQHPRLILLDEQIPPLRHFVENDERGRAWYARAKAEAERLYAKPVRKHELPDGRRLLSISRDVVNRIYHWGFFYRLEGDRKWLDRAWREMEAVVAFPDWNPNHYLDTAEMMHAIAIGYDWFYNDLSEHQRRTIRDGLWQHGLRLSHAAYMGQEAEGMQGWRYTTNNWNFVCNGGTSLAAMAVLDDIPEPCTDILELGFQYIQIPLEHFEPDGAWWEGVGYWDYAIRYFVPYLRGMETAFGTDFGFIAALQGTGFEQSGDFPVYLVSPLGSIYNFADSGSGSRRFESAHLFYLANRFQKPLYQHYQTQNTSGGLMDLLYFEPLQTQWSIDDLPLDKHFRGTEVVTMRGDWNDHAATFVGIKCGRNGIAHAHQDLGSFVLYASGEKWLIDLGTEHQTYLSHQHHLPRSDFYRIREEGHNTLVFNPGPSYCQNPKGFAEIERFEASAEDVIAVADLTDAYRKHAASVRRGYRLLAGRSALLVQDEFTAKEESDVWWFAHTAKDTDYVVDDPATSVTLRRGDQSCRVELLSPSDAKFLVMDAAPLPSSPNPRIQESNRGLKKLAIHLPKAKHATITVLFEPEPDKMQVTKTDRHLSSLDDWKLTKD